MKHFILYCFVSLLLQEIHGVERENSKKPKERRGQHILLKTKDGHKVAGGSNIDFFQVNFTAFGSLGIELSSCVNCCSDDECTLTS